MNTVVKGLSFDTVLSVGWKCFKKLVVMVFKLFMAFNLLVLIVCRQKWGGAAIGVVFFIIAGLHGR